MQVVVIDYGSGNLRSAAKGLERAAGERGLEAEIVVSDSAASVDGASRIVLPGVGAFGDCIAGLRALPGMIEALDRNVRVRCKPFLGICVGAQLLAERGIEHGVHEGLGWIRGEVRPLLPAHSECKIPHMGWNSIEMSGKGERHPLLSPMNGGVHVYFVHSFGIYCEDSNDVLATADHGGRFAAVVGRGNIVGTQFHPEKSQAVGLKLLEDFLVWDGQSG